MHYTETELAKLIQSVEAEFTAHLAKAEEHFEPEHKDAKEEPKHHEEHKKAHHEEKESEEHKESPEHDYDDEDMEHMHKMYMSMHKGEIHAHHHALKKAMEHHGLTCHDLEEEKEHHGKEEAEEEHHHGKEEEETKAHHEKKEAIKGALKEPKEMEKVEKPTELKPHDKHEISHKELHEKSKDIGSEPEIQKSEIAALKAERDGLKKNLDVITEWLKGQASKAAPQSKAITRLDSITKSEETKEVATLSKTEITTILTKKSSEPSLSKSDRELINAYYLDGASLTSISHLLK